jgi:thiol-disulfide isomerase/thioredoxin
MRALLLALVTATLSWASPSQARSEEPALETVRGDVTIVAFWASWCPPCIEELPRLEALQQRLDDRARGQAGGAGGGRVRVVAVSVDTKAKRAAARKVYAEHKMTVPLLLGGRTLYERYFKRPELVVPRLVVIDRKDHGLMSAGFSPDMTTEEFIRDLLQAVDKARGGQGAAPEGFEPLR